MRVRAETLAGFDLIVIDDEQVGKADLLGIVIVGKRKGMLRIQPAKIGEAAIVGLAQF